jgi:hypothetical protein
MRLGLLAAIVALLAVPAPGRQQPGPGAGIPVDVMPRRPNARSIRRFPSTEPTPIGGDTLTSNPRAYQAWLRRKIDEDLVSLHQVTGALVTLLGPATGDRRAASKHADRVVKLSHNIWSNLQMRRPTRERPKRDPSARPRSLDEARADAQAAHALVREIAAAVQADRLSRDLDAERRVSTLELLERLERIGLQVKLDVARNREQ